MGALEKERVAHCCDRSFSRRGVKSIEECLIHKNNCSTGVLLQVGSQCSGSCRSKAMVSSMKRAAKEAKEEQTTHDYDLQQAVPDAKGKFP